MKDNTVLAYNPFIEYFYTFGLDFDDLLQNENSINILMTQEQNLIKPKLINKFPPINKPISHLNEKHCFPNGFELYKNQYQKESEVFSFSLDNLSNLIIHPKIYYTCLVIYESSNWYNLFNKLKGTKNEKESSNAWNNICSWLKTKDVIDFHNISILIPKALCFASLQPFPKEHEWLLNRLIECAKEPLTIPMEKIIENIVMEIPMPQRTKFTIEYTFPIPSDNESTLPIFRQPMNIIPMPSYTIDFLTSFEISSIITIVKCLLLEIPILFFSSHKKTLTHSFNTFLSLLYPFIYQYPNVAILPIQNFGMIEIYTSFAFGINQTYTPSFFEENNIRINKKKIIIVDLIRKEITNYYQDDLKYPQMSLAELNPHTFTTKITEDQIPSPFDIELPSRYGKKLAEKLKEIFNNITKNDDKSLELFNYQLKDNFSYFLNSILSDYFEYMITDGNKVDGIIQTILNKKNSCISDIYKVEEYLMSFKSSDSIFYKRFLSTRLFYEFIAQKYLVPNNEMALDILHFDENCFRKKNKKLLCKKIKTPYFDAKPFSETQEDYKVPIANPFSDYEISFIHNDPTIIVNYFQLCNITVNQDQTKSKYTSSFIYPVFPKLLYDNNFFNNQPYEKILKQNNLCINTNIQKQFNILCSKIINDEHFFQKYKEIGYSLILDYGIQTNFEFENDVFVIWVKLFGSCLWYCDNHEKIYRFYEALENLKKLNYYRHDLLGILYEAIDQHGNDKMLIRLYEEITYVGFINNYTEYAYLTNKLSSETNTKAFKKTINIASSKISVVMYQNPDDLVIKEETKVIPVFRKRTIFVNCNKKKEEILYETESICSSCQGKFDLRSMTLQFQSMNKKYEMGPCPLCSMSILPKVRVLLPNNQLTSFTIYSPNYLLKMWTENIFPFYGFKINNDIFCEKYPEFFWNIIWYFTMKGLSLDLLLHYKKEQQEIILETDTSTDFSSLQISRNVIEFNYIFARSSKKINQRSRTIQKDSTNIILVSYDNKEEKKG